MAKVAKAHVLNTLEMRYDFQSARNVYSNWRKLAGLKDDPAELEAGDVAALADYLEGLADGTAEVAEALRSAGGEKAAPAPKDEPKGKPDDKGKPEDKGKADDKGKPDDKGKGDDKNKGDDKSKGKKK